MSETTKLVHRIKINASIEEVWRTGGRIPLEAALRCRVRYFTDGVVLGSQHFVNEFFRRQREFFGWLDRFLK